MIRCTLVAFAVAVGLQAVVALDSGDVKKMEEHGIIPTIIPKAPANVVKVEYGDLKVNMGNELTPTQVHAKPTISWPTEEGAFYTLIMMDPDIPPSIGAKEVQHWIVINVPGNDIEKGDILFDYIGSGPPEGSGLHRYIFLVYKQEEKLNRSDFSDIAETKIESRRLYVHSDLLTRLGLKQLVAGNFYRAQFDENVPKYHAERRKKFEKND